MLVVDAQVHMGGPAAEPWGRPPAAGLSRSERRERRLDGHLLPDEATLVGEMRQAEVDAAVLIPLSASMANPLDDREPCLVAARRQPAKFAVMGRIDPTRPGHEGVLDAWQSMPEMLGVRVTLRTTDAPRNDQDDALPRSRADGHGDPGWLWRALEVRQMPVMINAVGAMDYIGSVAADHPGLRIVVDHLGFAGMDNDELYDDLRPLIDPLVRLSRWSNVAVKASGLPAVVTETYPFPRLRDCLREVIGAFGSTRVFWGSNLSRLPCRYDSVVKFFLRELDFLSDTELSNVMGAGIVRWLGWRALEEML